MCDEHLESRASVNEGQGEAAVARLGKTGILGPDHNMALKVSRECPKNWPVKQVGADSCYMYSNGSLLSWFDARDKCIEHGGHLIALDAKDELETVKEFIRTTYSFMPTDILFVWLGLNDIESEGNYTWTYFGGTVSVSNPLWFPGQPDNNLDNENCIEFYLFGINDNICDLQNNFICEYNPLNRP
ncbi:C-type lectin 37Db-like [Diadema setosum]|uniref:C-type lectin 37Db-like n=1 Tax=Diadema setosum TaxID=31175 RepID=UPI003B3AB8A0